MLRNSRRGMPSSSSSRMITCKRRRLARVGFADDDGGVADRQHVPHVVHEFDRARAIDESQPVAEVVDAWAMFGSTLIAWHASLGAEIADAGALAHGTLARPAASAREQPLQQARLPALKGARRSRSDRAVRICGARLAGTHLAPHRCRRPLPGAVDIPTCGAVGPFTRRPSVARLSRCRHGRKNRAAPAVEPAKWPRPSGAPCDWPPRFS